MNSGGYHNEVHYGNKVYYVQTEDYRTSRPRVQTFVYLEGEVINAWNTPYLVIKDLPELDEIVQALMQRQHSLAIEDINQGRLEKEYINQKVQDLLSHKTLEDVILEYLTYQEKFLEDSKS